MILRPLLTPSPSLSIEPTWIAIDRSQRQDFTAGCWLIPQPAHAALAGEIAAQLDPKAFPGITPEVIRAIALHDSGWSLDDAAVIQASRAAGAKAKPYSFIAAPARDTVAAWTGSIEIAGKSSPLGGFVVSRHFAAIGQHHRQQADPATAKVLDTFLANELARQQKLRKRLSQTDSELDVLVTALQFCDLLSLYLACGVAGDVEFPQTIAGSPIQLSRKGNAASLTPSPFVGEHLFTVSALRHPKTQMESTQTFTLACG